jgi:thiol:disulfide interchange protein DsbD
LFGGLLQNPLVLVGLGVLFIALSLSMFGLYDLQPPPALMSRLGGTAATGVLGVFVSGLVVGVFAAPCAGPPVVALLAVVGAKGDPWFGFNSFFVLSMGLGAPYLLLATFSNLIQSLPRSGEWMNWVKKVFGVVMAALGVFYALLALAPGWALWVPAAALILGGAYLGFLEKSDDQKTTFRWIKRLSGSVAAISGAVIVITTPSPSEGIVFEDFSPAGFQAALASGQPVMLDFTAKWCVPCHELERFTFTDKRVRERARAFRALRVDLTSYQSPESERWRREYAINSVPTIVFIKPESGEVKAARVEGFLPPEMFLERMTLVLEGPRVASETD